MLVLLLFHTTVLCIHDRLLLIAYLIFFCNSLVKMGLKEFIRFCCIETSVFLIWYSFEWREQICYGIGSIGTVPVPRGQSVVFVLRGNNNIRFYTGYRWHRFCTFASINQMVLKCSQGNNVTMSWTKDVATRFIGWRIGWRLRVGWSGHSFRKLGDMLDNVYGLCGV